MLQDSLQRTLPEGISDFSLEGGPEGAGRRNLQ